MSFYRVIASPHLILFAIQFGLKFKIVLVKHQLQLTLETEYFFGDETDHWNVQISDFSEDTAEQIIIDSNRFKCLTYCHEDELEAGFYIVNSRTLTVAHQLRLLSSSKIGDIKVQLVATVPTVQDMADCN